MSKTHKRRENKTTPACRTSDKWLSQACIRSVESFIFANGRIPTLEEMKECDELPHPGVFKNAVGRTLNDFAKEVYPLFVSHAMPKEPWTVQKIKDAVDGFVSRNSRLPRLSECKWTNGLPSRNTFVNVTGMSYKMFFDTYYPDMPHDKTTKWTDSAIVESINSFIETNGRYPRVVDFTHQNGLPTVADLLRDTKMTPGEFRTLHFANTAYSRTRQWTKDKIRKGVDCFVKKNGRLPRLKEFCLENGLPCYGTALRVVGTGMIGLCREWYPQYKPHVPGKTLPARTMPRWTSEKIFCALDRFVTENNCLPLRKNFKTKDGLPCSQTVGRITGKDVMALVRERYPGLYSTAQNGMRTARPAWSKEKILTAIDCFYKSRGRMPKCVDFYSANDLPVANTVQRYCGLTVKSLLRERYPEHFIQRAPKVSASEAYIDRTPEEGGMP